MKEITIKADRAERFKLLREMIERVAAWIATDTIYC